MAQNELEICNSALDHIGANNISSLGEDTKEGRLCNRNYQKVRDALLASHKWNFAIKRVALVEDAGTPLYGFDNQYILPNDYLRAIEIEDKFLLDYKIEGQLLLISAASVNLKYISRVTDTKLFTPTFDVGLEYRLAEKLAYPLVQSISLAQKMSDTAEFKLKDIRSFDAMEDSPDGLNANEWLNSRNVGALSSRKVST